MTEDIRIEVRVRNNLILKRMEAAGIPSVLQLCKKMREVGVPARPTDIGKVINMKTLPEGKNLKWKASAINLANFFRCLPEDLFSDKQRTTVLKTNVAIAEIHFAQFEQLARAASPEIDFDKKEFLEVLSSALTTLPPRIHRVLVLNFGLDGNEPKSIEEIAEQMNITNTRIQQLKWKGIRLLKHPSRSRELKQFALDPTFFE